MRFAIVFFLAIGCYAQGPAAAGGPGTVTTLATGNCLTGGPISTTGTISLGTVINPKTSTYQVLAADFSLCKTITVASGTFTITLVASGSQPANGTYINVLNYGSGVVTVARSGQNINGGTASLTLAAGSATAPTSAQIWSDGANYFAGGSGGGGGAAPAGSAGFVQLYQDSTHFTYGNLTGGQVGVSGSTPTGGWYFSATADATGGNPNQCPVWWWGDDTCQQPSALMLSNNQSGDLSTVSDEYSTLSMYGQYTNTGGTSYAYDFYENAAIRGTGLFDYFVGATFSDLIVAPVNHAYSVNAGINVAGVVNNEAAGLWVTNSLDAGGSTPLIYGVYTNLSVFSGSTATTAVDFYAADLGPTTDNVTNPYYSWFDSRGVRRVKEDKAFDSVGQAIEALYNPLFTKYTPGAVNYERIVLGEWETNVAVIGTEAGGTGTLRPMTLSGSTVSIVTGGKTCTVNTTTGVWTCV